MLICVIDVGLYTIFVQLQSLVVISTHADRQSVVMSITVCLFVCLYICHFVRLRISPPGIKIAASNFARWFMGVAYWAWDLLFRELCSSRSPKSDESAQVLKICFLKKGHRIKGAGVRTP